MFNVSVLSVFSVVLLVKGQKSKAFLLVGCRLLKTRFAHISEQVRAIKALRGYRVERLELREASFRRL